MDSAYKTGEGITGLSSKKIIWQTHTQLPSVIKLEFTRCIDVRILGCFRTDLFARLFDEDCEGSVLPVLFADLFCVQQITTNDAFRVVGKHIGMSGAVLVHLRCRIGQE